MDAKRRRSRGLAIPANPPPGDKRGCPWSQEVYPLEKARGGQREKGQKRRKKNSESHGHGTCEHSEKKKEGLFPRPKGGGDT